MMRTLLIFSMLLLTVTVCGQNNPVPYRSGSQWGLSDHEGTIIMQPKFDSIHFMNDMSYAPTDMGTVLHQKKGLIRNGKEFLPAEYDRIFPGNFIRAEKFRADDKLIFLFDEEGREILPGGFLHIDETASETVHDAKGSYKIAIVQGMAANGKACILLWNSREKAIVQWLARDVYSAAIEQVKGSRHLLLRKRATENSPVTLERYYYENGKFIPADNAIQSLQVERKKDEDDYATAEPMEFGDISIDAPYGELDRGVEPAPGGDRVERKKEVRVTLNFVKEPDGQLALQRTINFKAGSKKMLKFRPDSFVINGGLSTEKAGDTIYQYNNYVLYRLKGKSGVLISDDLKKSRKEFDTIIPIRYSLGMESAGISFLIGTKAKSGDMKYGIMDYDGNVALPADYDFIVPSEPNRATVKDALAFKKDGRYGLVNPDGKILVAAVLDAPPAKRTSRSVEFMELRKGDAYGIYMNYQGKMLFLAPTLPEPVAEIYPYYLKGTDGSTRWDASRALLELKDASGRVTGYVRGDGFLYFKS